MKKASKKSVRKQGELVVVINKLMEKVELYGDLKLMCDDYFLDYKKVRYSMRERGSFNTNTLWVVRRVVKRRAPVLGVWNFQKRKEEVPVKTGVVKKKLL